MLTHTEFTVAPQWRKRMLPPFHDILQVVQRLTVWTEDLSRVEVIDPESTRMRYGSLSASTL